MPGRTPEAVEVAGVVGLAAGDIAAVGTPIPEPVDVAGLTVSAAEESAVAAGLIPEPVQVAGVVGLTPAEAAATTVPVREPVAVAGVVGLAAEEVAAVFAPVPESVEVAGVVGLTPAEAAAMTVPVPERVAVAGVVGLAAEVSIMPGGGGNDTIMGGSLAAEVTATLGTPLPTPRPEPAAEVSLVGLAAGEIAAVTQPVYEVQETGEVAFGGGPGEVSGAIADSPVVAYRAEAVVTQPAVEPVPASAEAAAGSSSAIQEAALTAVPVLEPIEVQGLVLAGVDEDTVPPPVPATDDRDSYGTEPEE